MAVWLVKTVLKSFHFKQHSRKDHIVEQTQQLKSLELQRPRGEQNGQQLEEIEGKRCQSLSGRKKTSATEKDPEFQTNSCWIDCWLTFTERRNVSHGKQKVTWSWAEGNFILALWLQQVVPNPLKTKVGSGSGRVVALAWHDPRRWRKISFLLSLTSFSGSRVWVCLNFLSFV